MKIKRTKDIFHDLTAMFFTKSIMYNNTVGISQNKVTQVKRALKQEHEKAMCSVFSEKTHSKIPPLKKNISNLK
jgi:hypothetical protein